MMNRVHSRNPVILLRWTFIFVTLMSHLVIGHFYEEANENLGLEKSPITHISVLTGSKAILPCDVASKKPYDKPLLVLFYKDSVRTPIYSLDARGGPLTLGTKWVDVTVFDTRVDFNLESSNPGLVIDPVRPRDNALYRCRVDFKASPTRNARIQLEVIVPPKRISIVNDASLEVSGVIGPYSLGSTVSLTCNVEGGHPLSKITWRKRSNIPYEMSKIISGKNLATTSTLLVKNLTRADFYVVYTCQAVNSNLISPMKTSVTLDMTFPPLEVALSGIEEPLTEGSLVKVQCEVLGSRPAANVTWWKNGFRMDNVTNEAFENGNLTRSAVYFAPERVDDGAQLVCRAKNPVLPMAVIETSARMTVLYSPRLKLFAGHGLNMNDIKDGDDVYFECDINANPRAEGVRWFHNGVKLAHNTTAGVIQSNQSLVLQKVRRSFSGDFACAATNSQGAGKSNSVNLSVKYAPMCRKLTKGAFGVEKNEAMKVSCEVNSNPEPRQYRWAFNTSSELLDLSWMKGENERLIEYSPRSDLDYGSLLCWAENEIGTQIVPCVFHIIHSTIPESVRNCEVFNVTFSSAVVFCEPGWGGGHDQTFTLQIIQGPPKASSENRQTKISFLREPSYAGAQTEGYIIGSPASKSVWESAPDNRMSRHYPADGVPIPLAKAIPAANPHFMLTCLEGGSEYIFNVFSVNRKGRSRPIQIRIDTPGDSAEKRVSQGNEGSPSAPDTALAILTCSLSALMVTVIFLAVVLRRRKAAMASKRSQLKLATVTDDEEEPPETIYVTQDVAEETSLGQEERTPDVIPLSGGNKSVESQLNRCTICKKQRELPQSSNIPSSSYFVEAMTFPNNIQRIKPNLSSTSSNLASYNSTSRLPSSSASSGSGGGGGVGGRCSCTKNNQPVSEGSPYFLNAMSPDRHAGGSTRINIHGEASDHTRLIYDSSRPSFESIEEALSLSRPAYNGSPGSGDPPNNQFNSLSRRAKFNSPHLEDSLSSCTLDKRFLKEGGGSNNLYRDRNSTSFIIEGFLNSSEVESSV